MNLFVFDSQTEADRRNWRLMCPGYRPVEVENSSFVLENRQPATAGVIVAHRLEEDLSKEDRQALFRSAEVAGLSVVIISGAGGKPAHGDPSNVYRRKVPVGPGVDTGFAACFKRFWDRVVEGQIDFLLLEPPSWPQNLVAVYLMARALQGISEDQKERIRKGWEGMGGEWSNRVTSAAWREFGERATEGEKKKWKEAGLPLALDEGVAESRKCEFLFSVERLDQIIKVLLPLLARGSSG